MPRPEPSRMPSSVRLRRYNANPLRNRQEQSDVEQSRSISFAPLREEQVNEMVNIPDRGSSRSRRGAIENLARDDRRGHRSRSAFSRRRNQAPSAMAPADKDLPSLPVGRAERDPAQQRIFQRATGGTGSRLPALAEVTSPTSPSSPRADEGQADRSLSSEPTIPKRRRSASQSATSGANSASAVTQSPRGSSPTFQQADDSTDAEGIEFPSKAPKGSSALSAQRSRTSNLPAHTEDRSADDRGDPYDDEHHADQVADYLDVVDPEVGALGYLSNIQNSIFVPYIPALYDRRPTHNLPSTRARSGTVSTLGSLRPRRASHTSDPSRASMRSSQERRRESQTSGDLELGQRPPQGEGFQQGQMPARTASRTGVLTRMSSRVSSVVTWRKKADEEAEYSKHIEAWRYMDDEERNELDEHVQLVLSKRSKFKRGLKGFWAFFKTPIGFIMTLYGFLITFWGTAIMFFIFSWIDAGTRRRYWIEICDQILCALFAAVGLGFAPFRAVDTYRMIHIAKLHHLTWERRTKLGLQDLRDPNDLPRPVDDGANQVHRTSDENKEKHSEHPGLQICKSKKHWWSLKHHSTLDSAHKESLTETHGAPHRQSSSDERAKASLFDHTRTRDLRMPAVPAPQDPSGKTGDLKNTGQAGRPLENLKRNESIRSELVKEREDIVVLTADEQELLEHHQRKFHTSHTFYRFHETATHRAFPLDLMITIVCLLDCHSLLQAALGGCTWGIKYTHRPTALTACLISASLSCNAMAGLLIYIGGRKTKKREEVERRLRVALEQMALEKIERRRARGELPNRPHDDDDDEEEEEEGGGIEDGDHHIHFRDSAGLKLHSAGHDGKDSSGDDADGTHDNNIDGHDGHPRESDSSHEAELPVRDEEDTREFIEAVDNAATTSDQQDYRRQHDRETLQQTPQALSGAGALLGAGA